MRDINRIEPFLKDLKEVWKNYPDLRFSQLTDLIFSKCSVDPFFIEDDKMLDIIHTCLPTEERKIKIGGIYKHFKGKYYIVLNVVTHSETKEKMALYKRLNEDNGEIYVRPLQMFLSEVDHVKYPEVTQKYRFELQTIENSEEIY